VNWNPFGFESVACTALGAVFLWCKLAQLGRRKDIAIMGLGHFWTLIGFSPRSRVYRILEFMAFVAIGVYLGIAIVDPKSPAQALTTGLGWTGLFAGAKHH